MAQHENIREVFGTPKDDTEAVQFLIQIFQELFDRTTGREGILEQYKILNSRSLPAYDWMLDAFIMVSQKKKDKHTFSYIVGILRQWMKYGYGHIPSQEEDDIISFMEDEGGFETSNQARTNIQKLMGTYGVVKIARTVPKIKESLDYSEWFTLKLEEELSNTFGPK